MKHVSGFIIILSLTVLITPILANERGGSTFSEGDPVVSTEAQPDPIMVNGEAFINDPRVNSDANACHEGGSLAGLCDTTDVDGDGDVDDDDRAWMWAAGWHLIQYEYSMVTRDQVAFFANMLPPEIIFIPTDNSNGGSNTGVATAGCYTDGSISVYWPGGAGEAIVDYFENTTCTPPGLSTQRLYGSAAAAEAVCGVGYYTSVYGSLYSCL